MKKISVKIFQAKLLQEKQIKISLQHIYRMIREGVIKASIHQDHWVIDPEELNLYQSRLKTRGRKAKSY